MLDDLERLIKGAGYFWIPPTVTVETHVNVARWSVGERRMIIRWTAIQGAALFLFGPDYRKDYFPFTETDLLEGWFWLQAGNH